MRHAQDGEQAVITREQAEAIALADAIAHGIGIRVARVVRLEEIDGRRPCVLTQRIDDHWIAYLDTGRPPRLGSSTVVVVDRADGRVLYRGSANDEG